MRYASHVRLRNTVYHWARVATQHDDKSRTRYAVNAGEKMHRRAGAKMHHGAAKLSRMRLSGSIKEPAFPSRPGDCWRRRAA